MAVGDLKTEKGVKDLDAYLADRSYVEGWQASQADIAVLEALGKEPTPANPHVLRWYKHIKSYDPKTLPGEKKATILHGTPATTPTEKPAKEADDEVDLFASDDEEDADAAKIREQRLKAYREKKSKKPALIAKSSVVLDVKPWSDETDTKQMEKAARSIKMDGLIWGASKLVPVGYGLNKLRIMCVVEDDKVSIDQLTEEIENFTDLVQSVDIVSFNKI